MEGQRITRQSSKSSDSYRTGEEFARAEAYKLLSIAVSYPDLENLRFIKDSAPLIAGQKRWPAWEELNRFLLTLEDASPLVLEPEYNRLFVESGLPPYETEYGLPHVFAKMNQLADIAGFYKGFGLTGSSETKERLDSLPVELEFMYYLILKQEFARTKEWRERSETCHEAQRRFLEAHLGRWAAAYCATVRKRATLPFYTTILEFAQKFLEEEVHHLRAQPERLSEVKTPDGKQETVECGGECEIGRQAE